MINPDRNIDIMGIINLTDDSYFAPSRNLNESGEADADRLAIKICNMADEGADIIDFGAASSRPGSLPVGWEEEWKRLKPALEVFFNTGVSTDFSIDTYHSSVISRAYELAVEEVGRSEATKRMIVNDISAGEDDCGMLPLVGRLGLRYIAMHKRGTPQNMQDYCDYDDVVADVRSYFEKFAIKAADNGISDWILDPGFGFSKNLMQNYKLLENLSSLSGCGQSALLAGVSRKSMIYKYLNITPEESLPATQVLHLKALQNGADILRVHDVGEAVRTVSLYRVLR